MSSSSGTSSYVLAASSKRSPAPAADVNKAASAARGISQSINKATALKQQDAPSKIDSASSQTASQSPSGRTWQVIKGSLQDFTGKKDSVVANFSSQDAANAYAQKMNESLHGDDAYRWTFMAVEKIAPTDATTKQSDNSSATAKATTPTKSTDTMPDYNSTKTTPKPASNESASTTPATTWTDLVGKAYNPPANLPPPPSFSGGSSSISGNSSASTSSPSSSASGTDATGSRGMTWGQRWNAIARAFAGRVRSGARKASQDAQDDLRGEIRSLDKEIARDKPYVDGAQNVSGFLDRIETQVEEFVKDPPHVANEIRKKLVNQGLDELESLVEKTGDEWLQERLKNVIKMLHELNEPSLKDKAKEKLKERYLN